MTEYRSTFCSDIACEHEVSIIGTATRGDLWFLAVIGSDYDRFEGTGTINGESEYKFMIWAGDGETDAFRIKIWTEDDNGIETVIFDNGFDQPIEEGSIVVHTK